VIASSHFYGQEIPCLSMNLKFHHILTTSRSKYSSYIKNK
jgi:hypothetical protein